MGRLFREFSVTIAAAVLVSGLISLTLVPMLCSRYLGEHALAGRGRLYRATEGAYQWLVDRYSQSLLFVLRHRVSTMAFSRAIRVATGVLF